MFDVQQSTVDEADSLVKSLLSVHQATNCGIREEKKLWGSVATNYQQKNVLLKETVAMLFHAKTGLDATANDLIRYI